MDPYYKYTTTIPTSGQPNEEGGGAGWIWGILLLLALLVIAGLIVWLVFLHNRDTKGETLELKDANVEVTSNTEIKATWTATTNSSDEVTLWATLKPPQFNSDGTLSNTGAKDKSNKASGTVGSVSVSGLDARLKYYTTLILKNSSKTSNYQVYSQLVYMDSDTPQPTTNNNDANNPETISNPFAIEDILQVGKLQLQTNQTAVLFEQRPSEGDSLWVVNEHGQIQKTGSDVCLYSNNGVLAASNCEDLRNNNLATSKWSYNPGALANRWCLANTTSGTIPSCMILDPISNGSATVKVANTSTVGDAWVNAYEVA